MKCRPAPDSCTHNTASLDFVPESQDAKHKLFANGVPKIKVALSVRTVNIHLFSYYSTENDGNDQNSGGGGGSVGGGGDGGGCTHEELLFK